LLGEAMERVNCNNRVEYEQLNTTPILTYILFYYATSALANMNPHTSNDLESDEQFR
jgi:hypothetical protein